MDYENKEYVREIVESIQTKIEDAVNELNKYDFLEQAGELGSMFADLQSVLNSLEVRK